MGYDYEREALQRMVTTLRDSADHLASSVKSAPPSPDAGDSSALLAKVISDLLSSGAAVAGHQDDIAGKIHASKGSYDDVENTTAGQLQQPPPVEKYRFTT